MSAPFGITHERGIGAPGMAPNLPPDFGRVGLPAELVRYPAAARLVLHGLLWKPEQATASTVVYVPGFGGGFAGPNDLNSFAAPLVAAGHAVLAINTRAVSPTGMVYAHFEDCLEDLDAALSFVRSRGYTSIVLVGDSLGGCRVAYYLAHRKEHGVAAVVFLGGIVSPYMEARFRWNETERACYDAFLETARRMIAERRGREVVSFPWGGGRPLTVSAETLVNFFGTPSDGNTDVLSHAKAVTVPALVLHGSRDGISLPENAQIIHAALTEAPSRELLMVNADHFFMTEADAIAYAQPLANWISRTLCPVERQN